MSSCVASTEQTMLWRAWAVQPPSMKRAWAAKKEQYDRHDALPIIRASALTSFLGCPISSAIAA